MDKYYKQVLDWSRQQAQSREKVEQQRIDDVRINSENVRLRAEHADRIRIYESQLYEKSISSAWVGGSLIKEDLGNNYVDNNFMDDYFE